MLMEIRQIKKNIFYCFTYMTMCTLNFGGSAYHMFPGRVILMEKSDLEVERVALFESVMKNQRSMKELESNLLCRLTSTQVCTE